jgi:hypothetical protein
MLIFLVFVRIIKSETREKLLCLFQIIRRTILSLTALFVLVLTANVYFVYVIVEERSPSIQTNNEVVVCIVLH